jgi:hypothetical protein
MLTVFVVVQTAINLSLLLALYLLLRERVATSRLRLDREERLEALAAEFCALGHAVTAGAAAPSLPAATAPRPESACPQPDETCGAGSAGGQDGLAADVTSPSPAPDHSPSRFQAANALLDRGLSVSTVAARTAVPDGEIQVLRNLRRAQKPAGRRADLTEKRTGTAR